MDIEFIGIVLLLVIYVCLKVVVYKRCGHTKLFLCLNQKPIKWILLIITVLLLLFIPFGMNWEYALIWLIAIQCVDMLIYITTNRG